MTQEIQYDLMNPTGNITILAETPVCEEKQPQIAAALMSLEPRAEQVGFLSASDSTDLSLRMAGGEFCANASMSAAAVFSMRQNLSNAEVKLSVSGVKEPVSVTVCKTSDNLWRGTVCMPKPESIELVHFQNGMDLPVVTFPGIAHVILQQELPKADAERLAVQFCNEQKAEALGLMFFHPEENTLTPLVYVPAANTLYWESACGSGTSAVGAWLARNCGRDISITLRQPAGSLTVTASQDGRISLSGTVSCMEQKRCCVKIDS